MAEILGLEQAIPFSPLEFYQDPYGEPRDPADEVPAVLKVRSTTHEARITLLNQSDSDFTITVSLWGWHRHGLDSRNINSNTVSILIPAHQYRSVDLTISGFPDFVCKGNFEFYVDYTHYVEHFSIDWYQNLAWTRQAQAQAAWLEVLNDACLWSDENTNGLQCIEDNTNGFFFSGKVVYEYSVCRYWLVDTQIYRLSKFVLETSVSTPRLVDCQDVSGYLCITLNALGLIMTPTIVEVADQDVQGFWTNEVCGIGYDPSTYGSYEPYAFAFHQIASNPFDIADAALAFWRDLDGYLYKLPAYAWQIGPYWQTFYELGLTLCIYTSDTPGPYEPVALNSYERPILEIY